MNVRCKIAEWLNRLSIRLDPRLHPANVSAAMRIMAEDCAKLRCTAVSMTEEQAQRFETLVATMLSEADERPR